MRRALVCSLCLVWALAAFAQTPFVLSKASFAIKISQPERQLDTLAPFVEMLSGFCTFEFNTKSFLTSAALRDSVTQLKHIPGIKPDGDIWIAVIEPPKQPDGEKKSQGTFGINSRRTEYGVVPRLSVSITTVENSFPALLIVPLVDAKAFTAYLETQKTAKAGVCGDYALLALTSNGDMPKYTSFENDIALTLKHDTVAVIPQHGETPAECGHIEVGFGTEGKHYVIETCLVPGPGSERAKLWIQGKGSTVGFDCARYLPTNLAYCSAGGPSAEITSGLWGMLFQKMRGAVGDVPDDQDDPDARMAKSLVTIIDQCNNGRALGIVTPTGDTPQIPTLVAVYQTTDPKVTREAARLLSKDLLAKFRAATDGALDNYIKLDSGYTEEEIANVVVDHMSLHADATPLTGLFKAISGGKADVKVKLQITFECRVTCVDDKMLFTVGPDGQAQMAGLIVRIQQGKAGFTDNKSYQQIKAGLPATVSGLECFTPLDILRCLLNISPPDEPEEFVEAGKKLAALSPKSSLIYSYQFIDQGVSHRKMLIPFDQMEFMATILNAPTLEDPDDEQDAAEVE